MDLDDVILSVHRLLLENLPARSTKTPAGSRLIAPCAMIAEKEQA